MAALLVLTLPLDWVAAAACAAGVHELSHFLAVWLSGGRIRRVKIGVSGTIADVDIGNPLQEFLCAAAGPVGSFLLLSLNRWFPKAALCAGIQGIYNLIPVYPLDGGRMLRLLLEKICPKQAQRAEAITEIGVLTAMVIFFYRVCTKLSLGIFPWIFTLLPAIKVFQRKIPCKRWKNRVQ